MAPMRAEAACNRHQLGKKILIHAHACVINNTTWLPLAPAAMYCRPKNYWQRFGVIISRQKL